MAAEHDRHVVLELTQNVVALDPESIMPWSKEFSPDGSLFRIREALYISALQLDVIGASDDMRTQQLQDIHHDLELDEFAEEIVHAIDLRARKLVGSHWTHSS